MTRKHNFPSSVLVDEIIDIMPMARRDMDLEEILQWAEDHPETLAEHLRDRGHPPEYFEDTPAILDAIRTVKAPLASIGSTSPLWLPPDDGDSRR